jgi:hypothetical protein
LSKGEGGKKPSPPPSSYIPGYIVGWYNTLWSDFFFSNLSQGNIWSRYHLPIIGFLNHYIEHSTIIRRKSFLYNRGDYNSYRQKLSTIDWHSMYILVMISTPLHVVKDKQLLT